MEKTCFTREIDHKHLFGEVMNICLSPICTHLARSVSKPNDYNTVVYWEAKGAKRMPQLKVKELWGDRRSVTASIFRLERRERQPRFLLPSTGPGRFTKRESRHWQDVVHHICPRLGVRLEAEVTRLDGYGILGLGLFDRAPGSQGPNIASGISPAVAQRRPTARAGPLARFSSTMIRRMAYNTTDVFS